MITLRFSETAAEDLSFSVSPLLEAAHSWHVLTAPGHHALHVPWVRRCRRLPAALRRRIRTYGFVVADYVPAFFECRADDHDADFPAMLASVRALPAERVAVELARTLVDTTRFEGAELLGDPTARDAALAGLRDSDEARAARLAEVLTDPTAVLAEALAVLEDYWEAAFAEEWRRIEPGLYEAIARAGQRIAHQGVLPMLRALVPHVRIDPARRTLYLDRPHDHELSVTPARPVTFTASHYVWPHVRVTCDAPWPLRITYPALPPTPSAPAPADRQELLATLRALAAEPRLQIAACLAERSRSTQELATELGLSPSVVSRHLQQMARAGLARTRRDGYYVLYALDPAGLERVAAAVSGLAETAATVDTSEATV
ncbi:DUF5937 family protein [Streptomyces sp. NPDC097619]|uniref:ArsR/SmtB family transcription factor n=1 Tax=Streptomyces sp. NPDC097619 TaxID=3157228 RepID=UPI003324F2D6